MKQTQKKVMSAVSLRKKLFSAAAMLLVASIMLVSTSYAWLVLSAAPEITGISTQMGANGSLEIALLNTESYLDLSKVVEADIDESLGDTAMPVTASNLSWGNLVSLANESYGLSQVVLNPSRLNIAQDGEGHKINTVLLKTPVYNEDGRIVKLEEKAVSSVFADNKFSVGTEDVYGVRAIGVAADMNEAQLGINTARATLTSSMAAARTVASKTLNEQGNALGNVAVGVALGSSAGFTEADVMAMKTLGAGLQDAMDRIDTAIRQVFLGYVYTLGLESEPLAAAIAEIEDKNTTLISLKEKYDIEFPGSGESDVVDLLISDQALVQDAMKACDDLIKDHAAPYTQDEIIAVMRPLVEYEKMTMGGYGINELKEMMSNQDFDALFGIVTSGGLTVSVPTGSGILSDIADFAGNYTAEVTVENVSFGSFNNLSVTASMATATTVNPAYLTQCNNLLRTFSANSTGGSSGSVITDYYGYAIDLAFRTNAEESNLQLQTDSAQRIYDDSSNASTQGGGSYMAFSSDAGLSATKMIKLMSGVRVVFMDSEQQVLAIAALDTTLGQSAYATAAATYVAKASMLVGDVAITPSADGSNYTQEISKAAYDALEDATKVDTENEGKYILGKDAYDAENGATIPEGKYAVLKCNNPQKSDYITEAEYNALADKETAVSIDADGTVRAQLYLYDFVMTPSQVTEGGYTGGITLGDKLASSAITALEENVAKQVTTLVYLDGSVVNNSMVAANSNYSMTGVMNLQFSSDATLVPMNNQELFDGDDDVQLPEIIEPDDEEENDQNQNDDPEQDDITNDTPESNGTDEGSGT